MPQGFHAAEQKLVAHPRQPLVDEHLRDREHHAAIGVVLQLFGGLISNAHRPHTLEAGKIRSEGEGEVQEMIDMCDFAVGLSRQLYGLTMASERPAHRLFEQFRVGHDLKLAW